MRQDLLMQGSCTARAMLESHGEVRMQGPRMMVSTSRGPRPWRDALAAAPVHAPPPILVDEDDLEMRRLVCEALRNDGHDVTSVADGGRLLVTPAHEAVDDGGANLVDLIVSDVRMPFILMAALFDKPLDVDDLRTAVSCLLRRADQTGGRPPIASGA